jgi:serine/threonine protein kinase
MTEERLNDLLLAWQEQHGQGRDTPAAELCRDCPELAGELARRIDVLWQMDRLAQAIDIPETTLHQPSPPASPSLPPSSVPGYEVLEELGRGGMGVVYKARQVKLDRLVALKMILASQSADLERFRTEGGAVARLQHPNIVQIYEVGEHAGRPYLVLEYVQGGSLAEKMKGAPLPPREAAALLVPLANAVQHAHAQGIVHRDLKPANVLLASWRCEPPQKAPVAGCPLGANTPGSPSLDLFTPKIADFGLAKRLDVEGGQTQTGAVLGTPSYMAPEQAEGRLADVGPATDVYALGATLYEMLTGRPPFLGTTVLQTLEHVCTLDPVPPRSLQPGIPRDLEVICLACLEKRPADRYDSAAALADDLHNFLAGEAIRARPPNLLDHFRRQLSRRDIHLPHRQLSRAGLAQFALAPFPFLILLAVHARFRDTAQYAVLITAVSTAIIVLGLGMGLALLPSMLRGAPPRQRRHLLACVGAEIAGTLLVWFLVLKAAPADRPETLFLVYPLWLLRFGSLSFALAADFGLSYLLGFMCFFVAIAAAFFLPWTPLLFGGLISLQMTVEGALKVWTRALTAPP